MPNLLSSLRECLGFSQIIRSTVFKISSALTLKSPRFPIGVEIIYKPFSKFFIITIFIFIVSCAPVNNTSKNNGHYSLEPGGQIEWSSPPFKNINDLEISLLSYKRILDKILRKRNLKSLYIGVDPFYDPKNIDLINEKKYQMMNFNMEKKDILGKWMMRNTSSIQINYDIIDEKDAEDIMLDDFGG